MQRFPCPFCGLRDEREFHFAGEAGKTRPDTMAEVSADDWATYLHHQKNPKGKSDEIWVHLPCQEYFVLSRDTVTMEVLGSRRLRKDRP
jgi:heterotetrameric sarcosine oxidase delta subunit